jgi:hypothetical protein
MTSDLREFELKLEKFVSRNSPLRPFVCRGSPLDRRGGIFIVGINPAKVLKKTFWDYWDPSRGFDKETHLQDLEQIPGGWGTARRKIEKIANAIGQELILDTNIYWYPAQSPEDIPIEFRDCAAFKFLLHEVRPRIVLAHGKTETVEIFRTNCREDFAADFERPADVIWDGFEFRLLCSNHLWLPAVKATDIIRALSTELRTLS